MAREVGLKRASQTEQTSPNNERSGAPVTLEGPLKDSTSSSVVFPTIVTEAWVQWDSGERDAAQATLEAVLDNRKGEVSAQSLSVAPILFSLAEMKLSAEDFSNASKFIRLAMGIFTKHEEYVWVSKCYVHLALVRQGQKRFHVARNYLAGALDQQEHLLRPGDPIIARTRDLLARVDEAERAAEVKARPSQPETRTVYLKNVSDFIRFGTIIETNGKYLFDGPSETDVRRVNTENSKYIDNYSVHLHSRLVPPGDVRFDLLPALLQDAFKISDETDRMDVLTSIFNNVLDDVGLFVSLSRRPQATPQTSHQPTTEGVRLANSTATGRLADVRRARAEESAPTSGHLHEKKAKKPKTILPELPAGLSWPTEQFKDAPRGTGIIRFLEGTAWPKLIAAGFGQLRYLRVLDESAVVGITSYGRVRDSMGRPRQLPSHLRFLTEREVTDIRIEAGGSGAIMEDPRLASAVASRLARSRKPYP